MIPNDVIKRLRYAMRWTDSQMLELFALGGIDLEKETLQAYFLKDDEAGYRPCPPKNLAALLDGFISQQRGPRPTGVAQSPAEKLDNNAILKKLRIALELKEEDMMAVMEAAGISISKNELSAFFRKKGQKNYKECLDQFLRNFLSGLAQFRR